MKIKLEGEKWHKLKFRVFSFILFIAIYIKNLSFQQLSHMINVLFKCTKWFFLLWGFDKRILRIKEILFRNVLFFLFFVESL